MNTVSNSEILKDVVHTLIKVIGRRTSLNFAIILVNKIIKQLTSKYNFLNYLELQNAIYSEKIEDIAVNSSIESID